MPLTSALVIRSKTQPVLIGLSAAPVLIALHAAAPAFRELIACQAIPNDALQADELPTRLKLFNWGENKTATKGTFVVGPKTLASLAANQKAHGFDKVALDFNHNSLKGHPNFKPDPREVAAYGTPVVIEGEGLFLDGLSYTPSGKKFAREYADLSPTPARDPETGEVIFLHSVALCPQGEVEGLTFLSADVLGETKTQTTHKKVTTKVMDFKKLLCAILSLDPDTATDEDIQAAAEKYGKTEKTEAGADKAVEALSKALKPFGDQLVALQSRLDKQDRDNLVALAIRDGKEIPKSALEGDTAVNNAQLAALIAGLPVTVPLSRRTPENVIDLSAGNGPISAEQAAINRNLGISDDQFKKHNAK